MDIIIPASNAMAQLRADFFAKRFFIHHLFGRYYWLNVIDGREAILTAKRKSILPKKKQKRETAVKRISLWVGRSFYLA